MINMEILGVKFAPLNVSLERRLQTLAVAIWLVVFVLGDFWGLLLTAYLLFYTETVRYFLLPYFLWIYYDWDTCYRGGRSEYFWTRWTRNNTLWRYFCNYFPIKLVKTVDLDPKKSYLFVLVPHGILGAGFFGAFVTDVLKFKEIFPGLEIHQITLEQHFKIPLFREFLYSMGFCSSSKRSLKYLLSSPPRSPHTGRATVLIVGGAAESLESIPDSYNLLVKRRKGFVKLALEHGITLVPVFSFGETNLYNQVYRPERSTFRRIQNYIRSYIGLAPVLFSGRGFFQYSFGLLPKRLPVTVVVGNPVELPKVEELTSEDVNKYHDKFIKQLVELFETQKHNYIRNAEKFTLDFL